MRFAYVCRKSTKLDERDFTNGSRKSHHVNRLARAELDRILVRRRATLAHFPAFVVHLGPTLNISNAKHPTLSLPREREIERSRDREIERSRSRERERERLVAIFG